MEQVTDKRKLNEFSGSMDNQISHAERRVYQAKNILRELRNTRHNIINGRKADPKVIEAKIDQTTHILDESRRILAQMYIQKFNLKTSKSCQKQQ